MADESTDFTHELTIGDIVMLAYRKAGIINPEQAADQLGEGMQAHAEQVLKTIVDEFPVHGVKAKEFAFLEISLTAGTYKYDLQSPGLLIIGDGMYVPPGQVLDRATGETVVVRKHALEWQKWDHSSTGTPNIMFEYRKSPNQVWLWPIPDAAGTLRIPVQEIYPSTKDESKKLSVRAYWNRYFIHALAAELAEDGAMGDGKIARLEGKAAMLLRLAKTHSKDVVVPDIRIYHPAGRRR